MFGKTPRKIHHERLPDKNVKENEPKILLASDSHSVVLLNALPLPSVVGSVASVLPKAGLACMTIEGNICIWDYVNVILSAKFQGS